MKVTDKTLLELMHITDPDISNRMSLLGLDSDGLKLLSNQKALIEDKIDKIVEEFYLEQTEIEEKALLIGDADTLGRLHVAQKKYTLEMFAGYCDAKYVNSRLRIGVVHKRIGVKPMLYLSALRYLKELLISTLRRNIKNVSVANKTINVLDKLFYFDTTLVFDTYIDGLMRDADSAKKNAENYAKNLEQEITDRVKFYENQVKLDQLTGIYNAKAMRQFLRREVALSKRHDTFLSLVYFDIDDFKNINDEKGHTFGDEVLKKVAEVLEHNIRETDFACRYGGDEFCILLQNSTAKEAEKVCEKIIEDFSEAYPNYSFSMGIAETTSDIYIDEEELIKSADEKMYEAKKQKGFKICL